MATGQIGTVDSARPDRSFPPVIKFSDVAFNNNHVKTERRNILNCPQNRTRKG